MYQCTYILNMLLNSKFDEVTAGMGVTRLPQSAASVEAGKISGVVTRPIGSSEAGRSIGLVWRSSSPIDKHLARVIAKLTK